MNNQTIDDILAEMRRGDTHGSNRIYTIPRYNPHTGCYDIESVTLDELADRIEEAAKRERGALVAEAEAAKDARNRVAVRLREEFAEKCKECKAKPGNASALREALEKLVYSKCLGQGSCGKPMDELCTYTGCIWHPYRAALAAPARNCGVAADAEHGSASAMREALEGISENLSIHIEHRRGNRVTMAVSEAKCYVNYARAALAAPPRNCDVGTAEEQADRFVAFCYAHRTDDNECSAYCPFWGTSAVVYCQTGWGQMPYEEGGKE